MLREEASLSALFICWRNLVRHCRMLWMAFSPQYAGCIIHQAAYLGLPLQQQGSVVGLVKSSEQD